MFIFCQIFVYYDLRNYLMKHSVKLTKEKQACIWQKLTVALLFLRGGITFGVRFLFVNGIG